jgi:hypothetical protein
MARRKRERGNRSAHAGAAFGPVWLIGWLFTIGYCSMPFFWQGVLALLIWPYYLGAALK